jgi:hypothetical protein
MKPFAANPEPDFKLYKGSCDLDYVRFFSTITKPLPLPPSTKLKILPMHAHGHNGMLLTIHDPKVSDLQVIARELPAAVFDGIEVFYDFTPKGDLALKERRTRIEDVRQWVISHLYPWDAEGIQVATRVSSARKHSEPVLSGEVERRARSNETMYFGHSDSKYAKPSEPNYASMRLYRKITDNLSALPPHEHRCRIEVTLNQSGCKHFGLTNPASIFGFYFRQFGQYFRLVNPEVRPYVMPRLRKLNPRMADLLEPKRMKMAADTLVWAGIHAASGEKLLNVDGKHRHQAGNRMIQIRLDDLTKKYKKSRENPDYGNEWGSF